MACRGREWPLLGIGDYGLGECAWCGNVVPRGVTQTPGAMRGMLSP